MKYTKQTDRYFLAAVFVIFGLNGFLRLIPIPKLSPDGQAFMTLLIQSGLIYVVKGLEVVGGILLLKHRSTPTGLTILGPIVIMILLFHLFLDPGTLLLSFLILISWCSTFWRYRQNFYPVLFPEDPIVQITPRQQNTEAEQATAC